MHLQAVFSFVYLSLSSGSLLSKVYKNQCINEQEILLRYETNEKLYYYITNILKLFAQRPHQSDSLTMVRNLNFER